MSRLVSPTPEVLSSGPAGPADPSSNPDNTRARMARAVRVLGITGRRLIEHDGAWSIFGKGDRRRRSLMRVGSGDVEKLRSEGLIVASPSGGYVLAPDNQVELRQPDSQPAAGPWMFEAAGKRSSARCGASFAALALHATSGQGPLSSRQAMAGLRLVEDAEQAARVESLTMDWDAAPADKNRRSGKSCSRSRASRTAQARLNKVKAGLGEGEFAFVYSACVQGESLRVLERRYGMARRAGAKALGLALEKVASVHDG